MTMKTRMTMMARMERTPNRTPHSYTFSLACKSYSAYNNRIGFPYTVRFEVETRLLGDDDSRWRLRDRGSPRETSSIFRDSAARQRQYEV
jgi:hypothetical protein